MEGKGWQFSCGEDNKYIDEEEEDEEDLTIQFDLDEEEEEDLEEDLCLHYYMQTASTRAYVRTYGGAIIHHISIPPTLKEAPLR